MTVSPENDPRRVGTIWMLNLDESAPILEPLVAAAFRPLSQDHLPLLASAIGVPASLLVRRFETGRRCYGAWVAEELAAYGWVSFDDEHIGELNLRVRLLPGRSISGTVQLFLSFAAKAYTALYSHTSCKNCAGRDCAAPGSGPIWKTSPRSAEWPGQAFITSRISWSPVYLRSVRWGCRDGQVYPIRCSPRRAGCFSTTRIRFGSRLRHPRGRARLLPEQFFGGG